MLQAQRWDTSDADAHVVLGVLYNVSRDYDSATEAFRRALEARPNDHSLWNKVGGVSMGLVSCAGKITMRLLVEYS